MPKGNHRPSKKAALVVLSDKTLSTIPVEQLQAIAIEQIRTIARIEQSTAMRAILLGLTLHKVKASLAHGKFTKWIKSKVTLEGNLWTPATTKKNASFFMRLASVAAEKARLTKPELLALPGDQTELTLDTAEGDSRRFVSKITKFIGEKSLNELLRLHGIKDTKPPTKPRADDDDDEKAETAPEVTAQIWREGISEWIESGRYQLLEEAPNVALQTDQLRNIEGVLTKLLADFRETHRHTLKG